MSYRKYLATAVALMLGFSSAPSFAQNGFLKSLGRSLGERVRLDAQYEVYKATHSRTEAAKQEAAENRAKKRAENKKHGDQRRMTNSGTGAGWTCPSCGTGGNIGAKCSACGVRKPAPASAPASSSSSVSPSASASSTSSHLSVYSSSSVSSSAFASVVFEDSFNGEIEGSAPSKWDVFSGDVLLLDLGEGLVMGIENACVSPKLVDGCLFEGGAVDVDFYIWSESQFREVLGADLTEAPMLTLALASEQAFIQSSVVSVETLFMEGKDVPLTVNCRTADRDRKVASGLPCPDGGGWHRLSVSYSGGECGVSVDGEQFCMFQNIIAPVGVNIESEGVVFIKSVTIRR